MGKYYIKDGKIQNFTCEINLTLHCNLTCRACSHMSPIAPKYFLDPERLAGDLAMLSKFYHAEHIRLLGGEPLLHPRILDIIDIVLNSGITDCVRIVTNGMLLWKQEDIFWEKVHQVYVTSYPGKEMTMEQFQSCMEKAVEHNVDFQINPVRHFRECFSVHPNNDEDLLMRIYRTCLVIHLFRSHTLHEGHLYKCTAGIFLPMFLKNKDLTPSSLDGIKIEDRPDFGKDLLAYLEDDTPPVSCKYCTGFVGRPFPLEYMKKKDWWKTQKRTVEEMLEWKDLAMLEWLEHLWKHFMFVEGNLKSRNQEEKIFSTIFGQFFFTIEHRSAIKRMTFIIEQIFGIHFTSIWEDQVWYKIYL